MKLSPVVSSLLPVLLLVLTACYSNNCPLESTVTCNYGFYDSEGTPIQYRDTINVSTLLPGKKTVYTYRQLGQRTITSDTPREDLVEDGYLETVSQVRRDTLLVNKLFGASSMKLPMKYYSESDTIILSYSSLSRKDTLYIAHNSYTNVDLPECGAHRFHHLLMIHNTDAGIDHVEIVNSDVNYEGRENIKIYFNGTGE